MESGPLRGVKPPPTIRLGGLTVPSLHVCCCVDGVTCVLLRERERLGSLSLPPRGCPAARDGEKQYNGLITVRHWSMIGQGDAASSHTTRGHSGRGMRRESGNEEMNTPYAQPTALRLKPVNAET